MPDWEFTVAEIVLQPGDRLFACTDGVPEATDADGHFFGKTRLSECLSQDVQPPSKLLEKINTTLSDYIGDAKKSDDITMVVVQRS